MSIAVGPTQKERIEFGIDALIEPENISTTGDGKRYNRICPVLDRTVVLGSGIIKKMKLILRACNRRYFSQYRFVE